MCISFIHVNPNPQKGQYRLVIASNRDEHYKRPYRPAHKVENSNIIGGLDMQLGKEGGMQLGFCTKCPNADSPTKHCVGILLNIVSVPLENPLGRGRLVRNFLESAKDFPEYIKELDLQRFDGFCLIGIEVSEDEVNIFQQSNKPIVSTKMSGKQTVAFGNCHVLKPNRKVTVGRQKFEEIIENNLVEDKLVDELFKLLKDKTKHLPDTDLQKIAADIYGQLSSICVPLTTRGNLSRSHTVILIDYYWNLKFVEHAMEDPIDAENPKWTVNEIGYNLQEKK